MFETAFNRRFFFVNKQKSKRFSMIVNLEVLNTLSNEKNHLHDYYGAPVD